MGCKVKIVRNDTGNVIADYEDCSIVGVMFDGNKVHRVSSVHTSPSGLIAIVEALQSELVSFEEKYRLSDMRLLKAQLDEMVKFLEKLDDGNRETT